MVASNAPDVTWRPDEKHFREREINAYEATARSQRRSATVQVFTGVFAALAAIAAAVGAVVAAKAVGVAEQNNVSQQVNDQFATAVSAIGGQSVTAQVAGLTLLQRNSTYQVQLAVKGGAADKRDAYDAYAASLDVFDTYLHTSTQNGDKSQIISAEYAAQELKQMLSVSQQVEAIGGGTRPALDLSYVNLPGVSWPGINFGWLDSAYMPHINLSGANLQDTNWANTDLREADLRCTDLKGADLRGASLEGADLRGADLQGAALPSGTKLAGVKTSGVYGAPLNVTVADPASRWSPAGCKF